MKIVIIIRSRPQFVKESVVAKDLIGASVEEFLHYCDLNFIVDE